jgi:transcriptional regulator with XRE-family HTH domain
MPRRLSDGLIIKAIAGRIREARQAKGWSREKVAEVLEVSAETVRRHETGETTASIPMLRRLARVLSVDYAWLLGVDPPQLRKGEGQVLRLWRGLGEKERLGLKLLLRRLMKSRA